MSVHSFSSAFLFKKKPRAYFFLIKKIITVCLIFSSLPVHARSAEKTTAETGPITALHQLSSVAKIPAVAELQRAFSISHWQTKTGARVFFVPATELPMLDVRIIFDAGAARDGALSGTASTVSRLIDEGTKQRDSNAIAHDFEKVGAAFSASSYRDMALVELRVLSAAAFRDPALAVFSDVLAQAQFPESSLARIRQQSEVGQQQQLQSPAAMASKLFFKALYGTHPYAEPPTGTLQSLAKITRADLINFYQKFYVAKNATIALTGDISRAEAEQIAEEISAQLPAGEAAEKLPAVPALTATKKVHHKFSSAQTHIVMGAPGIAYGDADAYALEVGNEILGGGGFTARLMAEVREKRGLTYGVSSGFSKMRVAGPFTIGLSTRADQTAEALAVVQKVLSDFIKNGPTENEVAAAKANLISSFPLGTASNSSILGYLGLIGFYHLPLDFLNRYVPQIKAVTAADIQAAFARTIHPKKLIIVTVGETAP